MGRHRERDLPSRRAATRPLVNSQGCYTHTHFTLRPINRDFVAPSCGRFSFTRRCQTSSWRNVGLLGGLLFDRVFDPLVSDTTCLNASLGAEGAVLRVWVVRRRRGLFG